MASIFGFALTVTSISTEFGYLFYFVIIFCLFHYIRVGVIVIFPLPQASSSLVKSRKQTDAKLDYSHVTVSACVCVLSERLRLITISFKLKSTHTISLIVLNDYLAKQKKREK